EIFWLRDESRRPAMLSPGGVASARRHAEAPCRSTCGRRGFRPSAVRRTQERRALGTTFADFMRVLHVTFGFPPDPPGGTGLYVAALCHALESHNVKSVVAAPGPRQQGYTFEGVSVRRFAVNQHDIDLTELYGEGDPRAAAAFDLILDEVRPDVVHQHALTAA